MPLTVDLFRLESKRHSKTVSIQLIEWGPLYVAQAWSGSVLPRLGQALCCPGPLLHRLGQASFRPGSMLLQLCMLPTESRECPQFVSSRVTTADAEIKVISAENPELSTYLSLKPGWSRSEYNPGI